MKSSLLLTIACCVLLIACESKSSSSSTDKDSAQVKAMSTVDERTSKKEALEKLTPYGLNEMQALMPKEIEGMPQRNFNYSMQWSYAYATADYNKTKALGVTLAIYDCAGKEGSEYYLNNFYDKLSQSRQDSVEYIKSVDLMGGKAIESYNEEVNYATLKYMANNRILVVIQGKKMTPEELIKMAQKLKFKAS